MARCLKQLSCENILILPSLLFPLHSLSSLSLLPSFKNFKLSQNWNWGKKNIWFWILNVDLKSVPMHFMQTLKNVTFNCTFYDHIITVFTMKLFHPATDAIYFTVTDLKPYRCTCFFFKELISSSNIVRVKNRASSLKYWSQVSDGSVWRKANDPPV